MREEGDIDQAHHGGGVLAATVVGGRVQQGWLMSWVGGGRRKEGGEGLRGRWVEHVG